PDLHRTERPQLRLWPRENVGQAAKLRQKSIARRAYASRNRRRTRSGVRKARALRGAASLEMPPRCYGVTWSGTESTCFLSGDSFADCRPSSGRLTLLRCMGFHNGEFERNVGSTLRGR